MLHFRCLNYPLLYRVRVWRSDSMQPPTARLKEAHYNENVGSGGGERKGSDWVWVSESVSELAGERLKGLKWACIISVAILSLPGLTEKVRPWINKSQYVWLKNVEDEFDKRQRRHDEEGGTKSHMKTITVQGNTSLGNMKFHFSFATSGGKARRPWICNAKQQVWAAI